MRELVPDDRLRAVLAREKPRLPLSYLEASVPLRDGWDARCAYLLLSAEAYRASAADARDRGWPVREIPAHGTWRSRPTRPPLWTHCSRSSGRSPRRPRRATAAEARSSGIAQARGLVLPMPVAEARAYVEAEGSDAA